MRRAWLLLLITFLCLGLAGCLGPDRGDDDDDDDDVTPTPTPTAPPATTQAVWFVNELALNDKVIGVIEGLTPAAAGETYAVWLRNDAMDGYVQATLDDAPEGKILVQYVDPTNADLLATYSGAVVSVEDAATAGGLAAPSGPVVLTGQLSADLTTYGRELLSTWPGHPLGTNVAPVQGLMTEMFKAQVWVHVMEDEVFTNMNLVNAVAEAEKVYNIIVGEWNERDLNGSGGPPDRADGDQFGVFASDDGGTNSYDGYYKAVFDLTGLAIANEADDTPAKIAGDAVRACNQGNALGALGDDVLVAGLGLAGSGDQEAAELTGEAMHVKTDTLLAEMENCVQDGVIDMLRIQLLPPPS